MFCVITDLAFPNSSCTQEVQPDFTDAIQHQKMFYSSDFQGGKKKKGRKPLRPTTVLSTTSLQRH